MCIHKFGKHALVCLAVVMPEVAMLDVYAQSDTSVSQLRFAGSDACQPDSIEVPLALKEAPADDQNELPILIQANEVESEPNVWIKLLGNAQVTQGKRGVYADQITYDQQTAQATATQNVRFYTAKGDEVLADSLNVAVDTGTGVAQNVHIKFVDDAPYYTKREHQNYVEDYSLLAPFKNQVSPAAESQTNDGNTYMRARATADTVEFEDGDYGRLYNATFSNCVLGKDDVVLFAKELELDYVTGVGKAKSIKVKFKRIPVFYLPIASFPINDKRKSGFLFPKLSYEKTSGIVLIAPYYINIAPNRDATLTPKFLSKRGVQLYGEYRYLTQKSETQQSVGIIKAEALPSDKIFNDDRYAFIYQHKQNFNDQWNAEVDFHTFSDTRYLGDFGSGFGNTALSYVPQRADLLYRNADIFFKASASAYQAINAGVKAVDNPYRRLPELNLNLRSHDLGPFQYGIDFTFTRFAHQDNLLVSGTRLRTKPYISLPIRFDFGYLIPKLSLRTIDYALNNHTGNDSPSVIVPIVSVDSGLFLERSFERNGSMFMQTLEPRLFYAHIPAKREQRIFPNFDSGSGGYSSFSHIFRENRFFGGDRVGDTQQITLGLTSRILNDSGQQKLKLSVGQIFFLDDRQIGLTATSVPETAKQSGFLTEVTANINKDWHIQGFTRIGNQSNDFEFVQISANYYHSRRRNASIGYSRDNGSIEQVNLEFKAPMAQRWQINMESKYAVRENKIRDFKVGITYDDCCWATKLLIERFADGTGSFKNRFTISLELSVLGRGRTHLDF